MSSIHHQSEALDGAAVTIGGTRPTMGFGWMVQMLGGSVWGVALGIVGVWVVLGDSLPGTLGGLDSVERMLVGIGMLSGGQLVFLYFVAERIFPRTPRMMRAVAHWGLMGIGGMCFVLFVFGRLFAGVSS